MNILISKKNINIKEKEFIELLLKILKIYDIIIFSYKEIPFNRIFEIEFLKDDIENLNIMYSTTYTDYDSIIDEIYNIIIQKYENDNINKDYTLIVKCLYKVIIMIQNIILTYSDDLMDDDSTIKIQASNTTRLSNKKECVPKKGYL